MCVTFFRILATPMDHKYLDLMCRSNLLSAWYPGVRNGVLAKKKYFEVYFGNRVQLYEVLISQTLSSDLATQFEVEFSNDRKSWFGAEQVITADTISNPLMHIIYPTFFLSQTHYIIILHCLSWLLVVFI